MSKKKGKFLQKGKFRPIGSPIPKEILELAPYADPKCKLCRTDPKDLAKVHELKFVKGWSYQKIADYLSTMNIMGKDYRCLTVHFNKHVKTDENRKLVRKNMAPEVTQVLRKIEGEEDIVVTEKEVEKAYHTLTKMVSDFSRYVKKVAKVSSKKLEDDKEYEKAFSQAGVVDLLSTAAGLQKELANQIKTITALRTPKIIMAHVFGEFVDDMTRELNALLLDTLYNLQDEVTEALSNGGVTNDTFVHVFQKTAIKYKDRMLMLRREHMNKVQDALADMEKVV